MRHGREWCGSSGRAMSGAEWSDTVSSGTAVVVRLGLVGCAVVGNGSTGSAWTGWACSGVVMYGSLGSFRQRMNHFSYFSDIEETFVRCRGRNLFISSKDWHLIETWQERDIPLHIVISAIESVFAGGKEKAVTSLAYCVPAVEERYKQWSAGRAGASDEQEYIPIEVETKCETCGREYCLALHR